MNFTKQDIIEYLEFVKNNNLQVILVEADKDKGFTYSYLMYVPQNPQNTLVMDCLNNYEAGMPQTSAENYRALQEIYSMFEDRRIAANKPVVVSDKVEEQEEETLTRVSDRIGRAFNTFSWVGDGRFGNAPILIPLIPGYTDRDMHHNESELNSGVVSEVTPQVVNMIADARTRVTEMTGVEMNDKIIAYGHSKSATFANNFATLHPEMVQAMIVGGREDTTLPLESISMEIVGEAEKSQTEEFRIIDGRATKRVTRTEFESILQEYNLNKKENQREITLNEDGTYSLPLNYPMGIADIEQYVDFSKFSGGKEEYIATLTRLPRMVFVGEKEEEKTGHFAYSDGITLEGQIIKAGEDIEPFELQSSTTEIERASMHNRVLENKSATRALFGKSANERLKSYSQLCEALELPMQSKIYEGVGHTDIHGSEALKRDTHQYYNVSKEGQIATLDTRGGASRISPIYQLMRRYLVSKDRQEYARKEAELKRISPAILLARVDKYITNTREISDSTNMDKIYDELSFKELEAAFFERTEQKVEKTDNIFISNMKKQVVTDDTEYLQQVDDMGSRTDIKIDKKHVIE